MSEESLPSFKRPPVVETVLGIQFEPVPGLTNAHVGAYWKSMGPEWPHVTDVNPLPMEFERFGDARSWALAGRFKLQFSDDATARVQIRNVARDRMLQLQNGRLHYNWIGGAGTGSEYTRYNVLRPEFDRNVAAFFDFLRSEGLPEPRLNQWEVTYVNQMPKGSVWNEPRDWQRIFPALGGPRERVSGTRLETVSGSWHFEIEPERGRLHVELQHGRAAATTSGDEVLTFKLTARGPISSDSQDFDAGISLGHDIIVRAFTEVTSEEARKHWEQLS